MSGPVSALPIDEVALTLEASALTGDRIIEFDCTRE